MSCPARIEFTEYEQPESDLWRVLQGVYPRDLSHEGLKRLNLRVVLHTSGPSCKEVLHPGETSVRPGGNIYHS